jgi:ribose transport system substrate-binding protein
VPHRAVGSRPGSRARLVAIACALSLSIALLATAISGTAAGAAGQGADPALQAAIVATNRAFEGTSRPVDPTPRAAVKGKHLVIISAGQRSPSASVPVNNAIIAAKTIGWNVDMYDADLDPGNYPKLVSQAIAADADALLLVAIDCRWVKQQLAEARAKGIAVGAIGAFDCNDPAGGGDKRGYFNSRINFGAGGKNLGAWVASYGVDQANYIIAKSNDKANVLLITAPEFTTFHYTDEGFRKTIAKARGSKIVSTLDITNNDFGTNQVMPKIQAELLRHPEVNWIRSPFAFATTIGVVPALGSDTSKIDVMGGEGSQDELDLIREGKIAAAAVATPAWGAWAAIDSLNSVFRHEKPVDSGFGWVMTDRTHNLPASGDFVPAIDYQAAYRKAWGIS